MSLDLIKISGNSYITTGINSIGVVVNDNKEAILIDSGFNIAKDINKLLKRLDYKIVAIINTHHHADHCGGNNYFIKRYPDIKIYSTNIEKPFIENTNLVPNYFCSGAASFKSMIKNPFFETKPSIVTDILPYEDEYKININNIILTIYPLPGHTNGMIGVASEDNVFYLGDCIFGEHIFQKYTILVYSNILSSKNTYEKLKNLANKYKYFIAYHGGNINNILPLIELHENKIDQIIQCMTNYLIEKKISSVEDIIATTMNHFGASYKDIPLFLLDKMTMQSYISYLEYLGKISLNVENGKLMARI